MTTKAYVIVSMLIFALVAVVHLIRFALGWQVMLGMTSIPLWVSLLAVLISASIALWGFTLLRRV